MTKYPPSPLALALEHLAIAIEDLAAAVGGKRVKEEQAWHTEGGEPAVWWTVPPTSTTNTTATEVKYFSNACNSNRHDECAQGNCACRCHTPDDRRKHAEGWDWIDGNG